MEDKWFTVKTEAKTCRAIIPMRDFCMTCQPILNLSAIWQLRV